ncbi:MAG: elongation factor G [Eubacteriaceae bacterium]|nr:elongation factor G [Eubacteriaceae bacterium]
MKIYESKDLRNVAVFGHGSSGKTTIAEAMAYKAKLIDRMGKVDDKTTVSDFDAEEQARQFSISMAILPLEYSGVKINLLDTPGYFDFVGEQVCALRVADAALIVVDALSGVEVGTEKAWELVKNAGVPAIFVVNKTDRENVDFNKTYESIKKLVGSMASVYTFPVNAGVSFDTICEVVTADTYKYEKGVSKKIDSPQDAADEAEAYREEMMETAVSADEELMEKYLEGETLTLTEINSGIKKAVLADEMIPIMTVAANNCVGIDKLMDAIINILPSPLDAASEETDPEKPASVFVFKTIADPYVGKLSIFKVMNGKVTTDLELKNTTTETKERINHIYTMAGKKQIELEKLNCGDIGAFSKLKDTVTNNILTAESGEVNFEKIAFPKPIMSMSITPKSKDDEDKLGNGVARIKEEDPTIAFERNSETNQNLITGMGEMHISVVASKLKAKYGVDVELDTPIVPYRETVRKKAEHVEGKHKKQSGGSGQFGVVYIDFEPSGNQDQALEFVDAVVGGTVPRQFIPAVEKGLQRCVVAGVLAGYPVVGLKTTLLEGKYHPVDSDEISFITAATLAYRAGMPLASPVLLQPIYTVVVTVPDSYMGDIMGDISKKSGRVIGSDSNGGKVSITAEVPLGEMFKYATELRSMTQGRGSYDMEFARYEEVPVSQSEKIIADAKARKENQK